MEKIIIKNCKVESSEFTKMLFRLYFARNWWWIVLPPLVVMLLTVVNVWFMVAALIYLFVVLPMVLTIVYFNYSMTMEMVWSLNNKTFVADDNGISMVFDRDKIKDVTIAACDVRGIYRNRDFTIFMLSRNRYSFVMVPNQSLIHED